MKNFLRSAALAAGVLLCVSASQAFADLELVSRQAEPDSWSETYNAVVGNSGLTAFDRFRVIIGNGITYEVSGTTYTISTPSRLEDLSGSASHYAIQDFVGSGGGTSTGWAQTFIDATPYGTFATASGNLNTGSGATLQFKIFFEGDQSDGTHYDLQFFNGGWSANEFVIGYEIKDIYDDQAYPSRPDGYERTAYRTLVPLPGSVWSGMALMGGLGLVLARRRRKSIVA